ncbi:hypothetical protein BDL97_05G141700 [Sphagnum fallax]|nr:hypothetical protein BDL97_05G141700 [Sphagnum fallax]
MNPEFQAQEDRGEHSDWLNDHQIFQSILVEGFSHKKTHNGESTVV